MGKSEKINRIEVGERVRAARTAKGWSGVQLGVAIKRSQNTISKIERGENSATLDNIAAIAQALGVQEDYLWGRTEYMTKAEETRAAVVQMQKDGAMWMAFINHIALFAGYQIVIPDRNSGDVFSRDTEYLGFEKDGKRYSLSLTETNALMKEIVRHSSLALKIKLEEGGE